MRLLQFGVVEGSYELLVGWNLFISHEFEILFV